MLIIGIQTENICYFEILRFMLRNKSKSVIIKVFIYILINMMPKHEYLGLFHLLYAIDYKFHYIYKIPTK